MEYYLLHFIECVDIQCFETDYNNVILPYLDSVELLQDDITFKKIWAQPLKFNVNSFGKHDDIHNKINESFNINAFPEIIFLTKYLGDYDISIYGDKYLIENAGYTLVLTK